MIAKRRRSLQMESLESRIFLSATRPVIGTAVTIEATSKVLKNQAVTGTIRGSFALAGSSSQSALFAMFSGQGTNKPLGKVAATGSLFADLAKGRLIGQVTLANARGSVQLGLIVPTASLQGRTFKNIQVAILGATGDFAALRGAGSASIQLGKLAANSTSGQFLLTFRTSPPR
jgi:hypothetical protein